ncbi:prolyl oligopeptidase family serine peptidase [Armatimonas sp.]|uniref:S9 family peptidase n=1 Tax=Armatimonas sp. TaxID=1872638 RepID=UPI003750C96E
MNRIRLTFSLALSFGMFTVAYGQETLPARVNGGTTINQLQPAVATVAAAQIGKRPLKHYDYELWKSIQSQQLARDGKWVVYGIAPAEGDGTLFIRSTAGATEYKIPRGRTPQLTPDSRFVVFSIAPLFAESEKARKDKKPALPSALGILDLTTGKTETIEKVRRFTLASEGSRWLAYQLEKPVAPPAPTGGGAGGGGKDQPPAGRQGRRPAGAPQGTGAGTLGVAPSQPVGADLILFHLELGVKISVPDVTDFVWHKSGERLAYVVDGKDETRNGLVVWDIQDKVTKIGDRATYSGITWDESGQQLVFVRTPKAASATPPRPAGEGGETPRTSALWHWKVGEAKARELVTEKTPGVPTGWQLAETGQVRFSKDGSYLNLALAPKPSPKPKDPVDPINVDIWATGDGLLQTMQKLRSTVKPSYPARLSLKSGKLTVLSGPDQPTVLVGDGTRRWALGRDAKPYQQLTSWDQGYDDIYLVDIETAERKRVLTKQGALALLSPSEKYLLWWSQEQKTWLCRETGGERVVNLGAKIPHPLWNEDDDHPAPPPTYGSAGWTEGDKSVLLYDKFDLWEVNPENGDVRQVTGGRKAGLTFRLNRLGFDPEKPTVPTNKPLLFSVTDQTSKAEGYWRATSLREGRPTQIVMDDCSFGPPIKARDAETVLFTRERFDAFPDLWLAPSISKLTEAVKITDANPQQKDFVWGKSELMEYTTGDGQKLPAVLTLPDNFDPNKKYPLMVYIYERMADQLHNYVRPGVGTSINVSRYVSNGYIVLRPDITYRTGYPGESALKCVIPAVQEVLRRGYVDAQRIGIQGHSWGAYEITYLITRSNLFRAVEAGAAVSDMVSAYGGIRYESGMSRAFQYERTQSRIGGPPWTDPLKYIENSPIFWVDKVQTPYLSIHNDADGAVPWTQGIEFFSAMRRLGKEAFMFNYNGEGHGLTNRENMKHWTVHMAEFFDHYLLNTARPEWMQKGVPYAERGVRDLRTLYTRPEEKK